MYERTVGCIMGIIMSAILVSCASLGGDNASKTELPRPAGAAVWSYISVADPYTEWKWWPGKTPFYPGAGPHGALLTTYVTDAAHKALIAKTGRMPYGTIIVKENYTPDRQLTATTVMYKSHGYNPEAGDWFWAKYAPDGRPLAEGRVRQCIDCHSTQRENDYIMTGPIK